MRMFATEKAPKAIGPYSQSVSAGGFLFTAGQIPLDPETAKLVEGDFEVHVRRVLENLREVLASGGARFDQVVKATVFLRSFDDFPVLNKVYAEYFGDHKPARSTVAVAQLPLNAAVEIELVAFIG